MKLTLKLDKNIDQSHTEIPSIRDQIMRWQQLFSPDQETYSLEGYEDLYVQGAKDLLIYDNFAEDNTMWRGFEIYRKVWEKQINSNFPGFVMFHIEVDAIEVTGDLAWSGLTWWGSVIKDGQKLITAQHATHIWRKIDGVWRIVHEHLTSGVKENGQESIRSEELENNAIIHERQHAV